MSQQPLHYYAEAPGEPRRHSRWAVASLVLACVDVGVVLFLFAETLTGHGHVPERTAVMIDRTLYGLAAAALVCGVVGLVVPRRRR